LQIEYFLRILALSNTELGKSGPIGAAKAQLIGYQVSGVRKYRNLNTELVQLKYDTGERKSNSLATQPYLIEFSC